MSTEATDSFLGEAAPKYLGDQLSQQYADNFPGHQAAIVTLTPRRCLSEVLG